MEPSPHCPMSSRVGMTSVQLIPSRVTPVPAPKQVTSLMVGGALRSSHRPKSRSFLSVLSDRPAPELKLPVSRGIRNLVVVKCSVSIHSSL